MEFRPARKNEIRRCAKLAGKSFEDYVFYRMFPMKERKRLRFIHAIMNTGVRCAFAGGALFVAVQNGEIVSVAILERPEKKAEDSVSYFIHGGWKVLLVAGSRTTREWMNMLEECDAAIHGMAEPHWYLSSLTTANGWKGKGVGSWMLQEGIIPWIKERGGGELTLITNSQENKRFYERNGFLLFGQTEIVRSGRTMKNWSFRMTI